ncbi:MAG TPA: thioredoxin domain-containing protein [Candidatus Saccharimonadaceae bacterium]|nr:thioredoxin domain-containing protein [Candidatus Saccharimonadaceae bacterium]|tara:strand:- start:81 stop:710 length:630 start_codon:yes stop_codon:yes gene_type:complete
MNKRFIIVLAAIIVGFVAIVLLSRSAGTDDVTTTGSSNVYGNPDSKVTLTEYVDFQCEACYAFYPTVKEVKEKYKDTVKFEIKYFPISSSHSNALAAAAAAQAAAKQGKFFEMHDMLFERQKSWENMSTERTATFESYAKEIGLDIAQYNTDLASAETKAIINADLAEVKKLGGNGTPTFALNGEKIDNPQNTVEAFTKLLDDALAKSN